MPAPAVSWHSMRAPDDSDPSNETSDRNAGLVAAVYDQLHALAQSFFRSERADHTLQPTALVHEAYLRLARQDAARWRDAGHFRALAAVAMRRVLVDHARRAVAQKRGEGLRRVTLSDVDMPARDTGIDVLALHEALEELADLNERQSRVVELRCFGGLTLDQAAAQLNVSRSTAAADWSMARAWLNSRLAGDEGG